MKKEENIEEVKGELVIEKPELPEVKAEITNIAEIEDNILEVKEKAEEIEKYYSSYLVTDETTKVAKKEITTINAAIDKVNRYRIDLTKEYNKPLEKFTKDAKEVVDILNKAKESVNVQVKNYENKKLNLAKEECREFFDEYRQAKNISFVTYEDMNQKINLSDLTEKGSIKNIKREEMQIFLDNIETDLNTIESMDFKEEILVEYMKDRNLSRAIKEVNDRKKMTEALRSAPITQKVETINLEVAEPVEAEILSAPVVEEAIEEVESSFKVTTTIDKLKELVNFMKERGIKYESIK